MTIEQILTFNMVLMAALLSPGPAFVVAVRTTLEVGRGAGIALGAGLALVAASWTMAALWGLETIFYLVPWAYTGIKILGGLYLLYLAVMVWKGAREELTETIKPARQAFLQGAFVNLLNPKSVLFAAAVLVVIFPANMSPIEKTAIVINQFAVEMLFYVLLATLMNTSAPLARHI